jgi:hypothetical protein
MSKLVRAPLTGPERRQARRDRLAEKRIFPHIISISISITERQKTWQRPLGSWPCKPVAQSTRWGAHATIHPRKLQLDDLHALSARDGTRSFLDDPRGALPPSRGYGERGRRETDHLCSAIPCAVRSGGHQCILRGGGCSRWRQPPFPTVHVARSIEKCEVVNRHGSRVAHVIFCFTRVPAWRWQARWRRGSPGE